MIPTSQEIFEPAVMGNRLDSNRATPVLSVVIPAYYEEGNLQRLYDELTQALSTAALTYEIIFVDDGSADATWQEIAALHLHDSRVKGLRLSRNFGHQYALFAGLSASRGQAVVTMDADLQHPPAVIPELLKEWRKGMKIVHTIRNDHETISWGKKLTSKIFYKLFSFLSGVQLSSGMADFRLLDRQVANELLKLKEGGLFLRGLVQWVGYPSSKVEFQCRDRFAGKSKYNFRRMLKFAWAGITSFSIKPLRLGILIGFLTSLLAFYQLGEAIYIKFFTTKAVPGWASIIGIQSMLFGVLFVFLGIISEYIARILEEVRQRPRFIVSETVGFSPDGATHSSPLVISDSRTGLGRINGIGLRP
ncbi:MAG: glycosyltransferase family 2 protein [candidate division KSB1 bacterium]|nr:glycosyltransferase family 2 protein [candidate division KSB1 bacterium]